MEEPQIDKLLKIADVAKILGTTRTYVYNQLLRATKNDVPGSLKAIRLGNGNRASWRIKATDLDRWINSRSNSG